jgi:hypothetical protein
MISAIMSAVLAAGLAAQSVDEQRAQFDSSVRRQRAFEQSQFDEAGFQPIDEVVAQRRRVRRILFQEGHFILPFPGVEIERHRSGVVTLAVIGRSISVAPVRIATAEWDRLVRRDSDIFRTRTFGPRDPQTPWPPAPPPPPICHPMIVRFEAADSQAVRSDSASAGCGAAEAERIGAAIDVARLAVSTRPGCSFEEANPFWSFFRCFVPQPSPPPGPNPAH